MLIRASLLLVGMLSLATSAQAAKNYVEGEMIVRLENGISPELFEMSTLDATGEPNIQIVEVLVPELNLYKVKVNNKFRVQDALAPLSQNPMVKYATPNHKVTRRELPNDASFAKQWSMVNATKPNADIKALEAWKLGTGGVDKNGNDIVVAVVDGGVDVKHPDLAGNMWINKGEIAGNKKDDDGNGYIDDIYGWNAFNSTGTLPTDSHATHVAGIIGATGNNGVHVAGVNWKVKIMSVNGSSGDTATVAKAYGYVAAQKKLWLDTKGARGANVVVTNSSFGVDYADCKSAQYKAWNDLYEHMGSLGILSAAATANINLDVDLKGDVPTGCASDYIISVTNTDNVDAKNKDAGFGKKSIDLGAPGTKIFSTLPNNMIGELTGTSMATPHVAGAVALLHSLASKQFADLAVSQPANAALQLKALMLKSVDVITSLKDITVSGGRLNLQKSSRDVAIFGVKKPKKKR
jgi:subtilisin family serine protease